MPFVILLVLAFTVGTAGYLVTDRYARWSSPGEAPAVDAARKVGEIVRGHARLRAAFARRWDPEPVTGLALTLALLFIVAAGVVLGMLAYLVRTDSRIIGFDDSIAKWGFRHASPLSTDALNAVTQLGAIYPVVIVLSAVVAIVETRRIRNHWAIPFLIAVVGGAEVLQYAIKEIVDRARPAFNPAAATLGPSFPSGHSTTAAAFYAAAALLIGRQRSRRERAALNGSVVGVSVAVASSRVLLDFHWLTDVIGGLALGWAWFVICGIAFGGRILQFGAGAAIATEELMAPSGSPGGQLRDDQGERRAAPPLTSMQSRDSR